VAVKVFVVGDLTVRYEYLFWEMAYNGLKWGWGK
jgi:hypothetical protein